MYECRSSEEVFDLLTGGQGVFGIGVPGIVKELAGTISEFPAEKVVHAGSAEDSAEGSPQDTVAGFDELAERRRRKTS